MGKKLPETRSADLGDQ